MPFIVLLYALFASVFTIGKWGMQFSEPIFLVGSRMVLAGVVILGFVAMKKPADLRLPRKFWGKMLALGIFNIYLTNVLEFWGLRYLTSFKTCFIYSLSPFFSAILSYFLLSEKLTRTKIAGMIIGVTGMVPIFLVEGSEESAASHLAWFSWPELSVLGASLATVYGWILMREMVKESSCSPLTANGYSMAIGGVFALVHSAAVETWDPIPVSAMGPFLVAALILLIISNLICYNLYGFLLKKFTAPFMAFSGYMTPLFAAFFGWLFLHETIPTPFFVSSGVIFFGLYLFYREELRGGVRGEPVPIPVRNEEVIEG